MTTLEQTAQFQLALMIMRGSNRILSRNVGAALNLDDQEFVEDTFVLAPQATKSIAAGANFLLIVAPPYVSSLGIVATITDLQGTPGTVHFPVNRLLFIGAGYASCSLLNNNPNSGTLVPLAVNVYRS